MEKQGEYNEALKLMDLATRSNVRSSNIALIWFKKSEIYKKFGNFLIAIDCLTSALKISPRTAEYHLLLADLFFRIKIYGVAIVLLETALDINSELDGAKSLLKYIQTNLSDEEKSTMFTSISNQAPPFKKKHKKNKLKVRHKDKLMLANGRFDIEPEFTHLEPT